MLLIMVQEWCSRELLQVCSKTQQDLQEYLLNFFDIKRWKWLFLTKPLFFALNMIQFSLSNYLFWSRVVLNSVCTSKAHNLSVQQLCLKLYNLSQKGRMVCQSMKKLYWLLQLNTIRQVLEKWTSAAMICGGETAAQQETLPRARMLNHPTSYHLVPALEFLLHCCVRSWSRSRSTEIHSYKVTSMDKQQKERWKRFRYVQVRCKCWPVWLSEKYVIWNIALKVIQGLNSAIQKT